MRQKLIAYIGILFMLLGTATIGNSFIMPAASTIDDTKGDGDTTYTWSADKIFDQLVLKEGVLTNSAGLLAALSDETGTGIAVFGTAPTFTTSIAFTNVTDTIAGIQNQNLVDKSAVEEISANWWVGDDEHFSHGDGDDFSDRYNSTSGNYEIVDTSNNVLWWLTPAGGIGSISTANPYVAMYDSDAAGADRDDEYIGSVTGGFSTVTEDAEISDMAITQIGAGTAGTEYTWLFLDGSDAHTYMGIMTDYTGANPSVSPEHVAGYESVYFDWDYAANTFALLPLSTTTNFYSTLDFEIGELIVNDSFAVEEAGALTDAAEGRNLAELRFEGYHTDDYYLGAVMRAIVDAAVGAGVEMPTRFEFATTKDGESTPTLALAIDSLQKTTLSGKFRVGEAVGSDGIELDGTNPDQAAQFHGYIDSDVANGAYSTGYNTLTITNDINGSVSGFADWSELYITGDLTLSCDNFGAMWGNLELADAGGSLTFGGGTAWTAGLVSTVISPDGLVIDSGRDVAGVLADSSITAGYTNNGTFSAFAARKSGASAAWPIGFNVLSGAATKDFGGQNGETIDNATDGFWNLGTASTAITPATFAFTTEGDITITSSVMLLDGDDDTDNDTIDLQDGTVAGQYLELIAYADIDANDTCTIVYTDTTCTNCAATVFDKVGESVILRWLTTTWVQLNLTDSL